MSHHFSRIHHISLACISLALAGCGGGQAPEGHTLTPVPVVSDAKPATPPEDDASLLARRTSQYVQETSPLLDHQHPATEPSVVQWINPMEGQADPKLKSQQPMATATPAAVSSTTTPMSAAVVAVKKKEMLANRARPAAFTQARGKDDDIPQIVPESADQIPGMPGTKVPPVTIPTDEYEKKMYQQVHDYPKDVAGQLNYELLRFSRDEMTPDMETVSGMTAEDREIVSALLDGLNNFRNTVRADNNLLLSRKIQPLLDMSDRLRSEAELTIPTVALCSRVDSFGVYTPMDSPRFAAGRENEVVIYCEVGNFSSSQNDQKRWETRVKEETVLYTETGLPVWPEKSNAQSFVDVARNRRHDFFLARKIALPANLTIGRYLLKITLTDEQTNRVAEVSTPIQIVAK